MTNKIEIGPITFIKGENRSRYPYCNSIYIEQAGLVIDPSSNRSILEDIRENVSTVWLSHWHEDHIMYLDLFDNCPLLMHKADEPPLNNLDTLIKWYNLDTADDKPMIERWKQLLVEHFHYIPRQAKAYLHDKDVIELEGIVVEIIHVPGHTPGSLAFFFKDQRVVFMGDYDLTPFGPWYGDLYSDIDQVINSVNKLRKLPADTWLTGHESAFINENPGKAWDDYLAVIERREAKLYDLLKEPKTLSQIADTWIVYGKPREPAVEFRFFEQINMKKHVDRLIKKGLARQEGDFYLRNL